jgi:hypothetical protein
MLRNSVLSCVAVLLLFALGATPPEEPGESDASDDGRARRQVERVMNAGLPFAEKMLAERGEFAPFGAVMLKTGLIQNLNIDTSQDWTSEEVMGALVTGLRRGTASGEYRAVGTFALVEMRKPEGEGTISAVHVGLEHREGYCVDVYYPVVLRGEGLVLDEPVAGRRTGRFFQSCY